MRLSGPVQERIDIHPLRDHLHFDNLWPADVQQNVNRVSLADDRIQLVGQRKDRSYYYLELFTYGDLSASRCMGRSTSVVLAMPSSVDKR